MAARKKTKQSKAKKTTRRVGTAVKKAARKARKRASGAAAKVKKAASNPRRTVRQAADNVQDTATRARRLGESVSSAGEMIADAADFVDTMAQRIKSRTAKGGGRRKSGG